MWRHTDIYIALLVLNIQSWYFHFVMYSRMFGYFSTFITFCAIVQSLILLGGLHGRGHLCAFDFRHYTTTKTINILLQRHENCRFILCTLRCQILGDTCGFSFQVTFCREPVMCRKELSKWSQIFPSLFLSDELWYSSGETGFCNFRLAHHGASQALKSSCLGQTVPFWHLYGLI